MQQRYEDNVICMKHQESREWARLILKLRWIGLEDEAERLQLALAAVTPGERSSVSSGPINTD